MEDKRELKFLLGYCVLLGTATLIVGLLFHPGLLRIFSIDGKIDDANITRIYIIRKEFFELGAAFVLLSIAMIKSPLGKVKVAVGRPLLLITVLWSLFIIELGLRANPRYSTQEIFKGSPSYLPSPVSQHRLDPEDQFITSNDNNDTIRILSHGFSTRAFQVKKPPGEIRIFVMGGSHVYDANSKNGNDWPSLAQTKLQAEGYPTIKIINAGVPGWRTFDIIGRVIAELHYYDPDYVILCQTYNDLKYFAWASADSTPFHRLRTLSMAADREINLFVRAGEHSQIYLYLRDAVVSRKRPQLMQDQDYAYDKAVHNTMRKEGLRQFQINVETFVSLCTIAGIKPILATEPRLLRRENLDSIMRTGSLKTSTGLALPALLEATLRCDSIIGMEAGKFNIPFIDLSWDCSGKRGSFRDLIHYNRGGGDCAARKLSKELKTILNLK
jgi:hypothetical protein